MELSLSFSLSSSLIGSSNSIFELELELSLSASSNLPLNSCLSLNGSWDSAWAQVRFDFEFGLALNLTLRRSLM